MPRTKSSNVRKVVAVPPNTPEQPITFLSKKSDKYTYVYVATNIFYDSANGYQKNERKCIGRLTYKLAPDWKEKNLRPTEMISNDRYVEYFPEYYMLSDISDASTEEPDSDSNTDKDKDIDDSLPRSDSVKVGQYIAINKIVEKLDIKTHLKNCFSNTEEESESSDTPEEVVNRILDFVTYMIVQEDNAACHFENYAFEHALFGSPISDSTIGRLFASIDTSKTNAFLKSWNDALIKENKRHESRLYVSADGTNGPCEAGDIEFAEYGASKVDDGNPILGMMLAVELLHKLPIYYDMYYGSINDVSESQYMVNTLVSLGYNDIGFVLDRGFFSIDNIKFFEEKGFAYIIMAKGCKRFIRDDFLSVLQSFETIPECFIEKFKVYGTTKEIEIFGDGKKRYAHFYYRSAKIEREQDAFRTQLAGWEKALEKKHASKEKVDRRSMRNIEFYFNIEYSAENVILNYSRNREEIIKELSLAGYFAIITYDKMSAETALLIYKSRDVNEKLNMYKTFLGGKSYRIHDNEHLTGKAFVTFVAMIIRQSIYLHLNEAATKDRGEWEYYSIPMAIPELGKIAVTRLPNGNYALRRPLTKRQKRILSAFKISEKKAIEICAKKAEELNANYAEDA